MKIVGNPPSEAVRFFEAYDAMHLSQSLEVVIHALAGILHASAETYGDAFIAAFAMRVDELAAEKPSPRILDATGRVN